VFASVIGSDDEEEEQLAKEISKDWNTYVFAVFERSINTLLKWFLVCVDTQVLL